MRQIRWRQGLVPTVGRVDVTDNRLYQITGVSRWLALVNRIMFGGYVYDHEGD